MKSSVILFAAIFALTFTGCKKDDEKTSNSSNTTPETETQAFTAIIDGQNMTFESPLTATESELSSPSAIIATGSSSDPAKLMGFQMRSDLATGFYNFGTPSFSTIFVRYNIGGVDYFLQNGNIQIVEKNLQSKFVSIRFTGQLIHQSNLDTLSCTDGVMKVYYQ